MPELRLKKTRNSYGPEWDKKIIDLSHLKSDIKKILYIDDPDELDKSSFGSKSGS